MCETFPVLPVYISKKGQSGKLFCCVRSEKPAQGARPVGKETGNAAGNKSSIEAGGFSGLGAYEGAELFISRVLHKTYICVDESGTKAGAATVVEMRKESAAEISVEAKTVYLNCPFVYIIIDCETRQPIFMGTVMSVKNESVYQQIWKKLSFQV